MDSETKTQSTKLHPLDPINVYLPIPSAQRPFKMHKPVSLQKSSKTVPLPLVWPLSCEHLGRDISNTCSSGSNNKSLSKSQSILSEHSDVRVLKSPDNLMLQ